MILTKDGITIELTNPADIAWYKRVGYVEVAPEPVKAEAQPEPEPVKPEKQPKGKAVKNASGK